MFVKAADWGSITYFCELGLGWFGWAWEGLTLIVVVVVYLLRYWWVGGDGEKKVNCRQKRAVGLDSPIYRFGMDSRWTGRREDEDY